LKIENFEALFLAQETLGAKFDLHMDVRTYKESKIDPKNKLHFRGKQACIGTTNVNKNYNDNDCRGELITCANGLK